MAIRFSVWFKPDDDDVEIWEKLHLDKRGAMEADGTWPSQDYLDGLPDEDQRTCVIGNAMSIVSEHVEEIFFKPIGDWLSAHQLLYPIHMVESEEGGYRVRIEFVTEAGRQAFLKDHQKWSMEKPEVWWDRPGVPVAESQGGRDEFYDLKPTGRKH